MTTRDHTKGPSQRQLQVGEELRHAAVQILQRGGFDHPLLMDGSRITISEVSVSPDLKNATFYVMTLGGIDLRDTMQALHAFAPMIRHELSNGCACVICRKFVLKRIAPSPMPTTLIG
jgi:ribosome-binding factor A